MNILFVVDKIELKYFEFNKLVTNFWLIKEFLDRGYEVQITTINNLSIIKSKPQAICHRAFIKNDDIFYEKQETSININDFNIVMFRPDPPVDLDYINATYIFDFVDENKVCLINSPKAIRNFNEKLHALHFAQYMPENIITSNKNTILEFLKEQKEIILKPLNQCFGSGVMYLKENDVNTNSIIKNLTQNETSLIMVQKYIKSSKNGDMRVLTLGDTVLEECVQKLPCENDFKFSTHNDSYIKKTSMTEEEKAQFNYVAQKLNEMGIFMAGLDVINSQIIEINVTSPCYFIKEINNNFSVELEKRICDYILLKATEKKLIFNNK